MPEDAQLGSPDVDLPEAMARAIEELGNWWGDITARESDSDAIKVPLYHYTTAAGLEGLLRTKEFWFTSLFHMNDPSELSFGLGIADEILKEHAVGDDEIARFFCTTMTSGLRAVPERFGMFVASFSRSADDLGQWRAYSNDGKGYCLGLSPAAFKVENNVPDDVTQRHFIGRVIYDQAEVERRQRTAIEKALGLMHSKNVKDVMTQENGVPFLRELSHQLAVPLLWNALCAKHKAYQHEAEVRLILINDIDELQPHVRTRVRGTMLVPYIACKFPLDTDGIIHEISAGPAADPLALDSAKHLLRQHGYRAAPDPVMSQIPYRAL